MDSYANLLTISGKHVALQCGSAMQYCISDANSRARGGFTGGLTAEIPKPTETNFHANENASEIAQLAKTHGDRLRSFV